jgi:hypothetical protein
LRKGIAVYPGPLHTLHAWAYLPDLARAFVLVAERQATLPMFEVLHFPGHTLTGEELLEALARSARRQGLLLRTCLCAGDRCRGLCCVPRGLRCRCCGRSPRCRYRVRRAPLGGRAAD